MSATNRTIDRAMTDNWHWCWPSPGPTPVNQSLDAEIFDGDKVPLSETIVREAIQNSLDARLETDGTAVHVRISFHEEVDGPQIKFLKEAMDYRQQAGLFVPPEWDVGKVRWMNIEDFESSGLRGPVDKRTGDFWNYWLNFGLSNKAVNSRGGRGIGRVTFLIASTVSTVIGFTRRHEDKEEHACGMAVLKAGDYNSDFRSTHAYLAEKESGPVYKLHDSNKFKNDLRDAFGFRQDIEKSDDSGLSLAIPYPNEKLTEGGIIASVIEHFGPAVLSGILKVTVSEETLDNNSLPSLAKQYGSDFSNPALIEDPNRYIGLLHATTTDTPSRSLTLIEAKKESLAEHANEEPVLSILNDLEDDKTVVFDIEFPLTGIQGKTQSRITCVAMKTPGKVTSIDMFFRDGMYLPLVRSRTPRGYDMLLFAEDPALSDYLNLCEGKAHLDLLENAEVRQKLKSKGCKVTVKRLVKNLPDAIRLLFVPEVSEPDATVFADMFSVPIDDKPKRQKSPGKPKPGKPVDPPPVVTKRISPFEVNEIQGGFQVKANSEYTDWPASMRMKIAYADGARNPKWNKLDFDLGKMSRKETGCEEIRTINNYLYATLCDKDFLIEVSGFDDNRELDTQVRKMKNPEATDDA